MSDERPKKGVKYYLAGPMSGYPEYNFPAFERACELLRTGRQLTIASPHEIDHGETPETRGNLHYSAYMRAALKLLLECDGIIMLPKWEGSSGATLEFRVARGLSMPVFQIMTLEYKWWMDEKYDPVMLLEMKGTGLLGSVF